MIHDAQLEKAVEAMRADPFIDDERLLGTTQQDERMRHYARIALATLAPEVSDDDIIVLFQEGRKLDDIAQAVGLPKSTVHARLKKHGLTSARRGKIEWTHKMRCDLIGLRAIKVPVATIAKRLKVSRSAIYAELARISEQR